MSNCNFDCYTLGKSITLLLFSSCSVCCRALVITARPSTFYPYRRECVCVCRHSIPTTFWFYSEDWNGMVQMADGEKLLTEFPSIRHKKQYGVLKNGHWTTRYITCCLMTLRCLLQPSVSVQRRAPKCSYSWCYTVPPPSTFTSLHGGEVLAQRNHAKGSCYHNSPFRQEIVCRRLVLWGSPMEDWLCSPHTPRLHSRQTWQKNSGMLQDVKC